MHLVPAAVIDASGLAGRLQRVREVGVGGVWRRVLYRARRAAVLRARVRWNTDFGDQQPTAERIRALLTPTARAASEDPGRLRAALGGSGNRFLFPAGDASLRARFRDRHPAAFDRIVREADATRIGDLAWVVPGGTSDWHAALPGGGRWPLAPADQLGIGAARPIGDVRLSWEIGRSTHVVRLAQAAWLTGDVAYARAVVAQLHDFARANPPGLGIAWAHAQEVGIRAVAWLWAFVLTRDFGVFDAAALQQWIWLIVSHAEYVATHLADHPVTHNHLVSETAALAVLGMTLPELEGAVRWRKLGTQMLWREVAKLVDDEGVEAEYATHYHAFVLDSLLHVLAVADRAGERVEAPVRARIGAMAEFVALLVRADGTLPAIGDTDAGRAFRLGDAALDRRDALATAALLFDRSDWGAIAGDASGAFWLGGGREIPGAGHAPPPGRARRFDAAGIAIARSGYGADAEIVMLRAGPTRFRSDVERGHLHADALSVLWRIGSDDVLIDPGTFLYSEGDGWRASLRATSSHSCVVVDGRDQADVRTHRFGILGERTARWLAFEGDATHLIAAAEHPADGLPRVRRRIAWSAPGLLVLCDDVLGDGEYRIESWLQMPATSGNADGAQARLTLASGRCVSVQVAGVAQRIEVMRPAADDGPGAGWYSACYGTRCVGTALRLEAGVQRLPAQIVTVLRAGAASLSARVESVQGALRVQVGDRILSFPSDGSVRMARIA